MSTLTRDDALRVARDLLQIQFRSQQLQDSAPRSHDAMRALAELRGATRILARAGLARSVFHLEDEMRRAGLFYNGQGALEPYARRLAAAMEWATFDRHGL